MRLRQATVTRAVGARIEVRHDAAGEVTATNALAYPYQPVRGDQLLVAEGDDDCFIIGVLKGRGRPRLEGENVSLRARGRLRLSAGDRVSFDSPTAKLTGHDGIAIHAHHAVKQSARLTQRILDRIETLARDYDQVIEQGWTHHARAITAKVKNTFYINGGRIHLS